MPYQHIENIRSRSGEKVALLLTFENVVGLMALAAPAYALSAGWPFWLRMPVVIVAAVLGVMVTLDIGGMPFYQRVIWQARGMLRMHMRGYQVDITDLPGVPQSTLHTPVIPVSGPIQPWIVSGPYQTISTMSLTHNRSEEHEASYASV